MKSSDWKVPTIEQARVPDRWGPVDLIIAGFGLAAFLGLLFGSLWHAASGLV